MKITNKKILITGGGSGIGLALAERFMHDGNSVIVCGRRRETLSDAEKKLPGLLTAVCDVSKENERHALIEWIGNNHPDLSVLVNNAGIQNWMHISQDDFYSRAVEEIETNVMAPLHLITLFLKLKNPEIIMNVTSGLAFVQLSKVPVYCATKAFLHSFSLSLRHMVKAANVRVVEFIPPALNTDLGGKGVHDDCPPVSAFIKAVFQQLEEGKQDLTFGFSDEMYKASPETIAATYNRMNP